MDSVNQEEYEALYQDELQKYSKLYVDNLTQQNTALLQVSVGIVAILATLGKDLLIANKLLGVLGLTVMTITIFCVILGYWTSNFFLVDAQQKLHENYISGKALNHDLDKIRFAKFNTVLNLVTVPSFLAGLILIFAIIILFIFGIQWM